MQIQVITAFPGMFDTVFSHSIVKRAVSSGLVEIKVIDLRKFTRDKHNKLDDYPFGGGPGMVMMAEPLFRAVENLKTGCRSASKVILMSAQGVSFTQSKADEFRFVENLIIVCGHYKGVDQRFVDHLVDEEISIGDYILSGGEIPAMAVIDAVVRLLPGAIGNTESALSDSFRDGLLEGPQFTRPENFRGLSVPEILLSGHHAKINQWRLGKSLKITKAVRPDLLDGEDIE